MKSKKWNDIQYYLCRECNNKRSRKYYQTDNGKMRIKEALRRSEQKHANKKRARQLANSAVRRGELKRADLCQECGSGGRIEGHHPDYCSALNVLWLCCGCHAEKHAKDKKLSTP